MKKIILAMLFLIMALTMIGCKKVVIFEKEVDPYALVEYSKDTLVEDVCYIKNGTKFYPVYFNKKEVNQESATITGTRAKSFIREISLLPNYYKNEIIAYKSKNNIENDIKFKRYKEVGYSIGIVGAKIDEEGYLSFDAKSCVKNSEAYKIFNEQESTEIKIESVNGEENLNTIFEPGIGVLTGMEKDKIYRINFYAGTYYGKAEIVADTLFLKDYEIINVKEIEKTKNNYISITLPDDAKSGYYQILGLSKNGMFKYVDKERNNLKEEDYAKIDWNIPYYSTEKESFAAYSQQYNLTIPTKTKNIQVKITYDPTSITEDTMKEARLYSPDGEEYSFHEVSDQEKEYSLVCDLLEAMAGNWKVNISPKELVVVNIETLSNEIESEKFEETFDYEIAEGMEGLSFYVEYKNESDDKNDINGIIVDPNGQTYVLENLSEEGKLKYRFLYAAPGTYKIFVYHTTNSEVLDVYNIQEKEEDVDIITIIE